MTLESFDPAEFQRTFDDLVTAIRHGRMRAAAKAGAGLTAAQVDLLVPLADHAKGLPVSRIADAAGVTGPSATRMLGGLRDRGIVTHRRDTRDARVVNVRLSPTGRKALTAHLQVLRTRQRTVYGALHPSEREQLVQSVRHLTEVIQDLNAQQ